MRRITGIFVVCGCFLAAGHAGGSEADRPLDPVLPHGKADAWCPTGKNLDSYLDARSLLPHGRPTLDRQTEAAPPVVTSQGGVLLIEDSGVLLRNDRLFDLPMESIEFTPSGDGYQVAFIPNAYEPVTGQAVFTNASGWVATQVLLGAFDFPFGGLGQTSFWVTSTNMISFKPPTEPVKVGLCSTGCYFDEGQVLLDRLPRISPLQHGSFLYGINAYIQGGADRAVITWQYADPANLDVQVVLFPDGRIRFNYAAVLGINHGAPVVVTGNQAFWSDLRLGGDAVDPEGDVPIPAPDGPAMDLVGVTARQVGTSELLQVEFTLAAPPPAEEEEVIFYRIDVRDRAQDAEALGSVFLQWRRGGLYFTTEPVSLQASTLRFNLRLQDLAPTGDSVHLTFTTSRGDEELEDGDLVELTAEFAPPDGRMMLDYTDDLPITIGDRPIYEAFTYPELQMGEVLKAVSPLFEDPTTVEAFPILQNLWTDIWFFAGGFHAGGNAGADGIGFGSSAKPRSPSLLHLNNIYNYDQEQWTMTVLSHELAHRWLYHFAIDEGDGPSRNLNPAGSHPAGWVHTPAVRDVYFPMDYSVMGGSDWQDNDGTTFHSPLATEGGGNGFTLHELYLMGLAGPAEVDDWWYIANANPPLPNAYWAPNDVTVTGQRVDVTLDQLIAAEGPRFPAYPDTLQSFLTPMVLVARPGVYTQEEIGIVADMCATWRTRFSEATEFRGSVRCSFARPVVAITTPVSDIEVLAGDTVGFAGTASDDDGDSVELRWSFPGAAPDTTGEGPHPVTFTSTGVYEARLDGVDEVGMLAEGDTVQVTVSCPGPPPTEPVENLILGREGAEIRFTWTDLPVSPTDYVVLSSDGAQETFLPFGSGPSGDPGLVLPAPAETTFFKVAAREDPGCLGPY